MNVIEFMKERILSKKNTIDELPTELKTEVQALIGDTSSQAAATDSTNKN